jgi:hypothetical protein
MYLYFKENRHPERAKASRGISRVDIRPAQEEGSPRLSVGLNPFVAQYDASASLSLHLLSVSVH